MTSSQRSIFSKNLVYLRHVHRPILDIATACRALDDWGFSVSPLHWSDWESLNGIFRPTLKVVSAVAHILGVSVHDLTEVEL